MTSPKLIKCIGIFTLILFIVNLNAQEKKVEFKRCLGVGLSLPLLQIHEMAEDVIPGKRLLIDYDPFECLRVEGHWSMYDKDHITNFTYTPSGRVITLNMKERSSLIGAGLFGVYPKNHWKYIAGFRFSKDNYDVDEVELSETVPEVVKDHGSVKVIAGVLAAEYYFNPWFSLGGELSIMQMNNSFYTSVTSNLVKSTQKGILELGIALTFYPF